MSVTAFNKITDLENEESSAESNELLTGPALKNKLELLLQEKEINDQITNKIKFENENLKNQLSKIQIELISKQKKIEEQKEKIEAHNIDNEELNFLRLNLEFGEKCRKKAFLKKGFKTGSPEYKQCVLKRGRL